MGPVPPGSLEHMDCLEKLSKGVSKLVCSPKVSVVMPVFDAAETVKQAIASILNQRMCDFEFIIVDNGSTDCTLEVLDELARSDSRIRVLHEPKRGIASALNRGIEEARGQYIARMDADDESMAERFERQVLFLDQNSDIGLVASRVIFGGNPRLNRGYAAYVKWSNSVRSVEDIDLQRFVEAPVVHPTVMFRRELIASHGGYRQGDFPEDYELWLRWLERGTRMYKLREPLLIWNDRPERLSRTDPRYDRERFFEIKGAYLARWLQSSNPFHPVVWLIGAGRRARRRVRSLEREGIKIAGFVDVDPKKVDREISRRPVVHRDVLPPPGSRFLLSYVASRGAREDIRNHLEGLGYRLGRDFLLAA